MLSTGSCTQTLEVSIERKAAALGPSLSVLPGAGCSPLATYVPWAGWGCSQVSPASACCGRSAPPLFLSCNYQNPPQGATGLFLACCSEGFSCFCRQGCAVCAVVTLVLLWQFSLKIFQVLMYRSPSFMAAHIPEKVWFVQLTFCMRVSGFLCLPLTSFSSCWWVEARPSVLDLNTWLSVHRGSVPTCRVVELVWELLWALACSSHLLGLRLFSGCSWTV